MDPKSVVLGGGLVVGCGFAVVGRDFFYAPCPGRENIFKIERTKAANLGQLGPTCAQVGPTWGQPERSWGKFWLTWGQLGTKIGMVSRTLE